jgi:D-alanyl-D-alanine carboxypeptidase
MLKVLLFITPILLMSTSPLWAPKSASIVICAKTGTVLHESNADVVTHPASLTKMMTLYMTFKALRGKKLTLDQRLPVSKHASQQIPSKLGLRPGSTLTVREAILALITKSANDAAAVLGEALGGGSETHFASLMTQQAHTLGMTKTVFKNASGVPNKLQVTSARDMATLSLCLYKHFPEYFPLFKTQKFVHKGVVHANHNKLLGKIPGVDGIKTGFVNASGFNLAASMVRDNRRIIAVVMGGESAKARDQKMVKLLETTHRTFKAKRDPYRAEEYASLDDLMHTLASSESDEDSLPTKTAQTKKAVYVSQSGKVRTLNVKYQSVNDIINVIGQKEKPYSKPPIRKSPSKEITSTESLPKKTHTSQKSKALKTTAPALKKKPTPKKKVNKSTSKKANTSMKPKSSKDNPKAPKKKKSKNKN